MEKGKVKFIRKNGRVIPVRSDGGVDQRGGHKLRKKEKNTKQLTKDINSVFKKSGRKRTGHERLKSGIGTGVMGSFMFGVLGAGAGLALGAVGGKAGKIAGKALTNLGRNKSSLKFARAGKKLSNNKMSGSAGSGLGARLGVFMGVGAGIADFANKDSKVISNRKFNKEMGKLQRKRLDGSSV